jgi:hypothetical protein
MADRERAFGDGLDGLLGEFRQPRVVVLVG